MNYMYTSYYYGPYFHIGAGIIRQRITSGLMRDKEYSVIMNIGIESQTIQSIEVLFSELECMISMYFNVIPRNFEGEAKHGARGRG